MFKLVGVLFLREIKKIHFILFLILVLLISFIVCYFSYNNYKSINNNDVIINSKLSIEDFYNLYSNGTYDNYLSNYKEYIEESLNKVKINNIYEDSKLFSFENVYKVQVFLSIISIIIGSFILLNEYKYGTVKMFLNKGLSRFKIFVSFMIACICLIIVLNLFLFFSYTLCLLVVSNSFELFNLTIPTFIDNNLVYANYYLKSLIKFLIYMIPVIFMGLFAFFMSVIFLSRFISVCFAFFLDVFGLVIFQWLLGYNIRFLMYTFFPYLDYTIFNDKLNLISFNIQYGTNISMFNGNLILFFTSIILFVVAVLFFIKRDVN